MLNSFINEAIKASVNNTQNPCHAWVWETWFELTIHSVTGGCTAAFLILPPMAMLTSHDYNALVVTVSASSEGES